ncbi:MAG: VOC family protein [Rubrivivax sp.]
MSATRIDHLVIAAATLDDGVQWCERTLGVTPGPGGKHPNMGTHNRLLALASPEFPQAYLEIIAIDPDAAAPARARWFGLDEPALREALQQRPRLLHVVARTLRTTNIDTLLAALTAAGIGAGSPVATERTTAHGVLRWRIAGRPDGRLLFGGALPTLIEWGDEHPTDRMAASALALRSVTLGGLPATVAQALDLATVKLSPQPPALSVTLDTPLGAVTLRSDD